MLLFLLLLSLCKGPVAPNAVEQAAVQRVMQAQASAFEQCSLPVGRNGPRVVQPWTYAPALARIGLEGCPADFRAAWQDYRKQWEIEAAPNPRGALALARAARGEPGALVVEVLRDRSKRRQAAGRLQEVALPYGVISPLPELSPVPPPR